MSKINEDGWLNVITGLGIKGRDKRVSSDYRYSRQAKTDVEHLYAIDDMAEKVVDYLPEEMQREGFEIFHSEDKGRLEEKLLNIFKSLDGPSHFDKALKWARLYGGSGIIMGINDGLDPSEPVDLNRVKSIDFLNVMHRWELHPQSSYIQDDPAKPDFGMPELYQISPEIGGQATNLYIHADRVLRFDGARLPRNLFIANSYWHDSVLNRFQNALRNFQTAHDSVASLMHDFAQAVYKIKHLTEMIAQGQDGLVQKRLELVDHCRSLVNAIVIEEGEEFDRKVTSLSGVPEVLAKIEQRLVQSSKMPHTILLGESASGLGATGKSEKSDWLEFVARQQEVNLKPQLTKFFRYVLNSGEGPTNGKEPETWSVKFKSLWQVDRKEEAEIRKIQAETDQLYMQNGVIDPDEVARSRFTGDDSDILIDYEIRGLDKNGDKVETTEIENPAKEIAEIESQSQGVENLALNGAQVTSMVEIIMMVAQGLIPKQSGVQIIISSFPQISLETAERILGPIDVGSVPSQEEAEQRIDVAGVKKAKFDIIKNQNGKWLVLSESGELLGEHETEEKALVHLQAIEAAKRKRGDAMTERQAATVDLKKIPMPEPAIEKAKRGLELLKEDASLASEKAKKIGQQISEGFASIETVQSIASYEGSKESINELTWLLIGGSEGVNFAKETLESLRKVNRIE